MNEGPAASATEDRTESGSRSRLRFLLRPWPLATMTVFAALIAAPLVYRSTRFTGIPPVAEILTEVIEPADLKPEDNAFTYYEAALRQIPKALHEEPFEKATVAILREGWSGVPESVAGLVETHRELLDTWKQGTELPDAVRPGSTEPFRHWGDSLWETRPVLWLATILSARCLAEGRAEESWDWLRAQLRFSRHAGWNSRLYPRAIGAVFHAHACDHMAAWATHESVTSEMLEKALRELREIDALTQAISVACRNEYQATRKLLSSPADLLEFCNRRFLQRPILQGIPGPLQKSYLFVSGEPDLAGLLLRHAFANVLSQVDRPRCERTPAATITRLYQPTGRETPPLMDPVELDRLMHRSKVAERLAPSLYTILLIDKERARQAIIETCLAVELFRRRTGQYPESLTHLVPDFLEAIPRDPFGKRPDDRLRLLHRKARSHMPLEEKSTWPGVIVFSIGENGIDNGAQFSSDRDICVRLPVRDD